ncbi:MAG: DUF1015 domain-containing protein [Christensenellales bacterium]
MGFEKYGIRAPHILLPKTDLERWAVVACDQFTSEGEYWKQCEQTVGDAASALHLILPEVYLDEPGKEQRIQSIHSKMRAYQEEGLLKELSEGFVLVRRQTRDGERLGLVAAIDLERYSFEPGAKPLIRPTEGTIESRIPPRLQVRRGATLELPHSMVLVDDIDKTLIEPLASKDLPLLYDFELMLGGGHIQGLFVGKEHFPKMEEALSALSLNEGMLFAVGDGNHSLATAKAYWEEIKAGLNPKEQEEHPARYTLVELVNLHGEGMVLHPIHRMLFGDEEATLGFLCGFLPGASVQYLDDLPTAMKLAKHSPKCAHALAFCHGKKVGVLFMPPTHLLHYGTLQPALDALEGLGKKVDYIHGDETLCTLSKEGLGLFMPALDKTSMFQTVEEYGVLPKKTFSIGYAQDKRYYIECRRIG